MTLGYVNGLGHIDHPSAAPSENAANPPTDSKGLTMTDPLAYESGQDHQLDVYEVLALIHEDAFAGVRSAADEAAYAVMREDDLRAEYAEDAFRADAEFEDDRLPLDHEFEREPWDDLPDDDDFTFLPDYLRERG